jgi:hypothetical protein
VIWLGSRYEGNPRDWQVFETAAAAASFEATYTGSVAWRVDVDEDEQESNHDMRIEEQRRIGRAYVGQLARSARISLGLAVEGP